MMKGITEYNVHEKMQEIFDALENDHGILARANFSCCMTCATYELGNELEESEDHWGGVYYHEQDAEGLEDDGFCFVGFFAEDGKGSTDAAAKACEIFKSHGLDVDWNGDGSRRIEISIPKYHGPRY